MSGRFRLLAAAALVLAFAAGDLPARAQVPPIPLPISIPGLDPCASHGDCVSCSQESTCGWCGASGRCMTGAAGGAPLCSGGWAWNPPQCVVARLPAVPGDACSSNSSCLPCTSQRGCGWCGALGRCMSGGANAGHLCPSSWSWSTAQCAVGYVPPVPVVDQCGVNSNCLSCASRAGCGWCPSLNRCVPGSNGSSPVCGGQLASSVAQCAGHTPVPNPPGDSCGGRNSCGSCAAALGCGWCESLNRCVANAGAGALCPSGSIRRSASCPNSGPLGVPVQVITDVLNRR